MVRTTVLILAVAGLGATGVFAGDDDGLPLPGMGPGKAPATLVTEFDPMKDGLPYENAGSYRSPGDCLAMTLFAALRFRDRMDRGGGDKDLPQVLRKPGLPPPRELPLQAAASVAQMNLAAGWDEVEKAITRRSLWDAKTGQDLYDRMRETSQPQVVAVWNAEDTLGHAVLVYGYRDGQFLIYDPNKPGKTVTWKWDARGFAPPSFFDGAATAAHVPAETTPFAEELAGLQRACGDAGVACIASFAPMSLAVKTVSGKRVVEGYVRTEKDEGRAIAAMAVAGDRMIGLARVRPSGEFRLELEVPEGYTDPVRIVTVTTRGQLVGYRDISVRDEPTAPKPESLGIVPGLKVGE